MHQSIVLARPAHHPLQQALCSHLPPPTPPQVKRLLPDPPSMRGVVYSKDPSIVLDDTILRPPSAPSSPAKPAPLGAAVGAAAGSGADAGGLADMQVDGDEAPVLPAVPMNQQRKDAIRAKSAGSSGGTASGAVSAGGLAAALQAASLSPLSAVKEAQGSGAAAAAPPGIRAAPAAGGQQRLDWLSSVFGKDADKKAGGGGAGNGSPDLLGASPAASAGKAAAGGSGPTINLTATAAGAQWVSGGGVERVDMRPNTVTVSMACCETVWGQLASTLSACLHQLGEAQAPTASKCSSSLQLSIAALPSATCLPHKCSLLRPCPSSAAGGAARGSG